MAIKIGLDQKNNDAPLWYQRLVKATIRIIMPAFAIAVVAMPVEYLSPTDKNVLGIIGTFVTAVLSAMEYVLGVDNQ